MALITRSQVEYYSGTKSFTGDGTTTEFTVSKNIDAFPDDGTGALARGTIEIFIDGSLYPEEDLSTIPATINYTFQLDTSVTINNSAYLGWYIEFDTAPANGAVIEVEIIVDSFGNYQFTSLEDVINNFMIAYVGEGKVVSRVHRTDVQFHAMRALQELSFDTFKSTKSQEITLPPSLTMILPQDYVNYVKFTWTDGGGVEHVVYPVSKTSNPFNPKQNSDGSFSFDPDDDGIEDRTDLTPELDSETWDAFSSGGGSTGASSAHLHGGTSHIHDDSHSHGHHGNLFNTRYGIDPQFSHVNGSFFIDELKGLVHFSSSLSGQTITIKYISDSLGTPEEMVVHKLAEEAMYKWIAYAVLATRANTPEYIIARYKKERYAETRKAKLRLSNIKLEEITQILRGKSKHIKH